MRKEIKADIQSVIDNFSIINEWCKESADMLKRTCELYKYDKQKLQSIAPNLYV
jgi:RNA processing factor Prp31